VTRDPEAIDPAGNLCHGQWFAAPNWEPPDLRLAVVRRPARSLTLSGGREVNLLAIRAPAQTSIPGAVVRKPCRLTRSGIGHPEISLAVIGRRLPTPLSIGDGLAVGRDRQLRNKSKCEVVVHCDLVLLHWFVSTRRPGHEDQDDHEPGVSKSQA